MKSILVFFAFIALFIFSSCEKVIKVDLNTEDPKLVVEAIVNADSTTHYVTLTRTINFDEDKAAPIVTDALITVTDVNDNKSANYTYDATHGKYKVTNFLAKEGHTYKMVITSNGKTHTATSTIPSRVVLDSLKIAKYPFGPENEIFSVVPLRMDPAGIANYYQFRLKKNGEPIKGIYVEDDQGMDGILTKKPLFTNRNEYTPDTLIGDTKKWKNEVNGKIEILDSITADIELSCIENKVFRYFFTLSLNGGGQQSATPANPDPLFDNGALGYFSAQTVQSKKIVISNK